MYATAQLIGGRTTQCDATAVRTIDRARCYALLDGIGDSPMVRQWVRRTARRLARSAAYRGTAEGGLRAVHAAVAGAECKAVAVVAVAVPGQPLEVAWCGDARAYLHAPGRPLRRLTKDHNLRAVLLDEGVEPGPYSRNTVTSYLGDDAPDAPIGVVRAPCRGRLLLASDGAYEPVEDTGRSLAEFLGGSPRQAAYALTRAAVQRAHGRPDNATTLVADL